MRPDGQRAGSEGDGSCRLCAACSAVTKTGYLVKRGGAELFVCQSCLTAKFGTDYQLVRSLEPEPPRPVAGPGPLSSHGLLPSPSGRAPPPPGCPGPPPRDRQRPGAAGAGGPRQSGRRDAAGGAHRRPAPPRRDVWCEGAPAIRPPYYVQYQMNKVERQAVRLEGSILKIFTKERSP